MAATSLLVHPLLHHVAPVAAIAVPSTLAWVIAVWGAGRFHWGLASGMSVGLLAACITLKAVSFVQRQAYVIGRRASSRDGYGKTTKGVSVDRNSHTAAADDTTTSPRPTPTTSTTQHTLNFSEFACFMLTAPSLVCDPRILQRGARRPPRIAQAASEFFHAALTFVAFHATCSALFAPALRVIAAAAVPYFTTTGETSDWLDCDGWAALGADGGGGWLRRSGQDIHEGCLARGQWGDIVVAVASSVLVFSPMVHFMLFYGFWHCVCLGCAELWGYPNRDFYGPWWLLTDDPRALFRLWSSPVHRWMTSCIYRPMLEAGRPRRHCRVESDKKGNGGTGLTSPPALSEGLSTINIINSSKHAAGDGNSHKYSTTGGGATTTSSSSSSSSSSNGRGGGANSTSATAVGGGSSISVARSPASVGNSNPVGNEAGDDDNTSLLWRFLSLLTVFAVSGLLHEATTFVAMRRTCWPFNSFCLITSAHLHLRWDSKYPVLSYVSAASEGVAAGGGGRANKVKVGSEWRGWGAVVFYLGSSCPFSVLVEFLAWQWWRHAMR